MRGEESTAVRLERREERGAANAEDLMLSATGTVRAFAMLQAFAPKSRTWENRRFMS